MKNIKPQAWIWTQLIVFLIVWVLLLLITDTSLTIGVASLLKVPQAISVCLVLYFVFKKWGWRITILQGWFVPYPDLEGTWEGSLVTTWEGRKKSPSIPVILVIKQTFDSISCVVHTKDSTSFSNIANFSEDDNSGIKKLSFNYTNRPEAVLRDKSPMHEGAAILTIITAPKRTLKGEYWTNRRTTGSIVVTYKYKRKLEAFPKL